MSLVRLPPSPRTRLALALFASVASTWGLTACGGGAGGSSVVVPRVEPPPHSGLVWMTNAEGRSLTEWVSVDDGSPIASQPIEGPLWAEGDALWQWTAETVELPVWAELPDEENPDPATAVSRADVTRIVLRELVGNSRVVILEAPEPGPVREIEHSARVSASVGPYLFVRESLTIDAWGAHGSGEVQSMVWDLRAAAPAEILTEREIAAIGSAERREAQRQLVREGAEAGIEEDLATDAVELVAIEPEWDSDGLRVWLRFATEACYACGDGEWSDYTRSTRVAMHELPERLSELATMPGWVREVRARHPEHRLTGFTLVDDPAPARVLDTLHR